METLGPPYLLIATPALRDPNFAQTVVLMGQHGEQGALGWVINRLHDRPARDVLGSAHRERVHAETPLHVGGPVSTDTLLGLFHEAVDGVESTEVAPGLWLSSSADVLSPLFSRPPGSGLVRGRLVFGYSGWGPGQLEREMQEGAWLALPDDQDLAFAPCVDDLWRRCFDRLGINPALLTNPTGRKHQASAVPGHYALSGSPPGLMPSYETNIEIGDGESLRRGGWRDFRKEVGKAGVSCGIIVAQEPIGWTDGWRSGRRTDI